ncbi:type VI secretion system baseplate subunit TssG [Chitinophaga sp. S165]|uniref:type VI secretion system baseplate subunit TssG n=1 Tax=Chitinophaga sp. S165 TaxID=2135462 RepID=UPI000D70A382|nr:type VI secretion system baseplate subunit TssG [Chitinophaga sp. S165]PWV56563.1 type VI secretion system (T6SS) VasB/ImpH family protein [Chitinophaga sp. S165]
MKGTELNLQNDLHADFKATTKVAELLENGDISKESVAIIPAGPARSAYAKDISGYSAYYSENLLKDRLIIEVNREGLYDMLPEGLFHGAPARSAGLSELEMIADVQLRRTEERDARRFFMPFEAELNHMRTLLAWYENRLDKKTTYNDLSMIFGAEWKEFDMLDNDQRIIWMHLLPVIQQKRNDTDFMGKLLSVLFNIPVNVTLNPAAVVQVCVDESMRCKMGNGALGSDAVIGNSFTTEGEEINIKIGPADADRLLAFLPGSHQAQLIETVTAYLVPVETNVRVELITSEENRIGALGAGSANAVLGFTVYL